MDKYRTLIIFLVSLVVIGLLVYFYPSIVKPEVEVYAKCFGYGDLGLNNALKWIKENTPEGSIIMSWWDHGKIIGDSTNRNVVIKTPSRETLRFTAKSAEWYEANYGELSSHQKIKDVAIALINSKLTANIMDKYHAKFLFVKKSDVAFYEPLNSIATDRDPRDNSYLYCCAEHLDKAICPDDALNSVVFKNINKKTIKGLNKVYEDSSVVIYERE